jgi:hypothetical protein
VPDRGSRQAVEVAEEYADGRASRKQLTDAHDDAWRAGRGFGRSDNSGHGGPATIFDAGSAAIEAAAAATLGGRARDGDFRSFRSGWAAEQAEQCKVLRDIIGNPYRPVSISPAWQTPQVVALAQATYDERELPSGHLDAARLAVLADALEDAGCSNADILGHLRGPGPHVRGCFPIDLILGRGAA